MKQQIMLNRNNSQKTVLPSLVGSEAKNPLPATMHEITAMDLIGMSWMFTDTAFSNVSIAGERKVNGIQL